MKAKLLVKLIAFAFIVCQCLAMVYLAYGSHGVDLTTRTKLAKSLTETLVTSYLKTDANPQRINLNSDLPTFLINEKW